MGCSKAKKNFKYGKSILDPVLCTVDQGTDWFSTYTLLTAGPSEYSDYPYGSLYAYGLGIISLVSVVLPVLVNTILAITWRLEDSDQPPLMKICLVPVIIICSPFIQMYYLVLASYHLLTGKDKEGRSAERASQLKLIEALLEAFPQATIQIVNIVMLGGGVWWQWLSLASSLLSLSIAVSTSDYMFGTTTTIAKITFFTLGLISATARLLTIGSGRGFPFVIMLLAAVLVWLFKRCCGGCCSLCLPLSAHHRRPHHIILTITLTAFYNTFNSTGLLISTLNAVMTGLLWYDVVVHRSVYNNITILGVLQGQGEGGYGGPYGVRAAIISTVGLALSLTTFLANFILVCVPKFRRHIGDTWLNIHEDNKDTTLY